MAGEGTDGAPPAFSLFEAEEQILEQADGMLAMLDQVGGGVRALAEAYRRAYREQRRLVRLSDRMQADLHTANQRLEEQAADLKRLNAALREEAGRRHTLVEELRRVAITDSLTGTFTRRHLFELGEREIRRLARTGTPLSLLHLDIDHFKQVNDTHGHAAGDEALRAFARTCLEGLREVDAMGRIGGEEFAVLLPDTDRTAAAEVAERLRLRVAASPVAHGDLRLTITVSIGVATYGEDDGSLDRLLHRADAALYAAKAGGRNRVEIAAEPGET